jgi:6,7-dimethyl-8-ribityllumazine synthase
MRPDATSTTRHTSREGTHASDAAGLRVAIVASSYHADVTGALREGAAGALRARGGTGLVEESAPGAFELPMVAQALAARGDIDAVVAIGCVLTGETSHDRFICDAVSHGLMQVALRHNLPVTFGVLTCVTIEQARARAGGAKGNKGAEAMDAAIDAALAIRRHAAKGSKAHS